MRRWFLSYNSQDVDLARRLVAEIARKDAQAEIFFAPQSLRPGAYWMPALAKQIEEATAFVLLVGKNGLGPWQTLEYQEAVDRSRKEADFAVVPLVLDGIPAPGLPFLRQLHWIINSDPASELSVAKLFEAAGGGGASPTELWRHTAPYRGLSAMTETDADFFFGRERETTEVITALAATAAKLPLLLGNSGVGKSSLAQAGVVAALMRQGWPETAAPDGRWPQIFRDSRRWCFLRLKPGAEPLRALVDPFLWTWQFEAVDPKRAELQTSWAQKLLGGTVGLRDLLDATQARYRDELHQPEPPEFLLYIDQGEELYVRQAAERERRRFSEILAQALPDPRLRVMMSLRADFFGELQRDEALYAVHQQINVPPLREAQLREVVGKPAELLAARFESSGLPDIITRRTIEDSVRDVGALPLLSYTLDDMWKQMVISGDGVLRLSAPSFELGGVLVDRANKYLEAHPDSEDALRRILTLRLADVREDGVPTRRSAMRSEFSESEWRIVGELANDPNRLLVIVKPDNGETYAEVAHEAIFRRWDKLRGWIAAEREFLAWRTSLESARRSWELAPPDAKDDSLLMGFPLARATRWLAQRKADISGDDQAFIQRSCDRETAERLQWDKLRRRGQHARVLAALLMAAVIIAPAAWWKRRWLNEQSYSLLYVHSLAAEMERQLKPGADFGDCADCPQMVVIPAGRFTMGSAELSPFFKMEGPPRAVTIARPFAVSKFEIEFAQWDACVSHGDCPPVPDRWGRGRQPVIDVAWNDAQSYVAWLSRVTGKKYRLLTEAEWEYAARAQRSVAQTYYSFGNDDSELGQYAWYEANSERQPHSVGLKKPNAFGLFDMHGNVAEWVEDCYHDNYDGAPSDGSAWSASNCIRHVIRGGAYLDRARMLRSSARDWSDKASDTVGIRVARFLAQ
jgi:formylglycine-generating enzyme required for sulfatase activity